MEGWEPQRWLGGTAGFLLCPDSLSAAVKRGRFVPTALVSVVGRYLRSWAACLVLVTPCNVNPFCKEPSARSRQGHFVVECVSPGKKDLKPPQVLSKYV